MKCPKCEVNEKMPGWGCTTPGCLECVGKDEVCRQHWKAQLQTWTYFKTLHLFWGKKKKKMKKRSMSHWALLWAKESIPSAFLRHQKHNLKFHLNIVGNQETRLNSLMQWWHFLLNLNVLCFELFVVNNMLMKILEKCCFEHLTSPIDVNPLYLDRSGKLWVWLSRLHAELCCFYHVHLHSPVSKNFSQYSLN